MEKDRGELLKIRNFGEKSLDELYSKLDELGFLPEESISQNGLEEDVEEVGENVVSDESQAALEEDTA